MKRVAWSVALTLSIGIVGWLLGSAALSDTGREGAGPEWNVILISWDGTQRAHLMELYEQGLLPNLAALAQEGTAMPMEVRGHATDTKAGHAEILTGYGPEVTGIYSNRRFQAIPDGLTLFERLKARFGEDVATVAITGKKGNILEILENALPELDFSLIRGATAERNGPLMLRALEALKGKPFFAFFHFSDPDHAGHNHGENSREYSAAIRLCDRWLGEIVSKLRELGIYERTLIYISTDHGFDEGRRSHLNAPDIWFVTNDPRVMPLPDGMATQRNIAPTILERLGFDLDSLEPPLPGQSLLSRTSTASLTSDSLSTVALSTHRSESDSSRAASHPAEGNPFGLMLNVPRPEPSGWEGFLRSLDEAAAMGARFVRLALSWRWLEPEDGRFVWSGGAARRIAAAEERGLIVLPVLKIGRGWASGFSPPQRGDPSVPPIDLSDRWDDAYGYSPSYYDFVYRVIEHWRGHFPYVIIENEANAENFWAGTAEEYLRVLATAYKAAHDADPEIRVADSGIASGAWGVCIARDRLDSGEPPEEVLAFLQSYYRRMPAEHRNRFATAEQMRTYLHSPRIEELCEKVTTLLSGFEGIVDAINLHFYEEYGHLSDVLAWIDRRTGLAGYRVPTKVSNEYGIRNNDPDYDAEGADQAHELFKKLIVALSLRLEKILWFSSSEEEGDKLGLLGEGFVWREAAYAYQLVTEKIGDEYVFDRVGRSAPSARRYLFRHLSSGSLSLEAAWCEVETCRLTLEVPEGFRQAVVINYLGQEIPLSPSGGRVVLTLSPSPVFIEWR